MVILTILRVVITVWSIPVELYYLATPSQTRKKQMMQKQKHLGGEDSTVLIEWYNGAVNIQHHLLLTNCTSSRNSRGIPSNTCCVVSCRFGAVDGHVIIVGYG